MVTESKKNEAEDPITGDDDASVDPDRLAAIRMPTGFLKWVISTPLPKDDKENLWLDTLPPGSAVLKPPPKRKVLPPWAFAALATFVAAAIVTVLAFWLVGYFDSVPPDEPSGFEEPQPAAPQSPSEPNEAETTETTAAPQDPKPPFESELKAPEDKDAGFQKPAAKPATTSPVARPTPKNPSEMTQEPKSSPTEETPVRSKPSLFEME